MYQHLGRIREVRRGGSETFQVDGKATDFTLLDFWQWSVSDLVSNATRGRLAEYVVARALGISTAGVRDEWAAYDLETPSGLRIEVKSAAYLQSWQQDSPSRITFSVRKARAWDPNTNAQAPEPSRSADLYVFALLHHMDKATVDPLNLNQWCFFVLSTTTLNERQRSQHSITLNSLQKLTRRTSFDELGDRVLEVSRVE